MSELVTDHRTPRWVFVVIAFGLTVFGIYSASHMVAAGDTWVALACGRHFADHGVDTVEPFSFNSHHAGPTEEDIARWPGWARTLAKPFPLSFIQKIHPTGWINQNWLTHVIFYDLVKTDQPGQYRYNMLVYWKYALYVLTTFIIYLTGRVIGVSRLLALAAAGFGMIIGRSFFDIRPAAWSNMLVPALILLLALTAYRNIKYVWLLVPLVVFWANVHGGYLYAFIMLVPFIGLHILTHLPKKWTFAICSVGLWTLLYLVTYQLMNHEYVVTLRSQVFHEAYTGLSLLHDKVFYLLLALIAGSLAFAGFGRKNAAAFYCYHAVVTVGVFLGLLMRLFIRIPGNLAQPYHDIVTYQVNSTQLKYFLVLLLAGVFTFLLTWRKERLAKLSVPGIKHTLLASAAAFVAMIIFNPFHLTNLTHTFEISVSEHAESWRKVNEWRPAFDFMDPTRSEPNPVGSENWFGVFCILSAVLLTAWIVLRFKKPRPVASGRRNAVPLESAVPWPKIDLALLTVALLTIYMAIESRRFIAIAGPAAAPFAALLLQQIIAMALVVFRKKETPFELSPRQVKGLWAAAAGILLLLTGLWSVKYWQIYVAPWPLDAYRNSLFMRMTASNVKPFEVCDFMNLNGLSGRMFNYWTEGGAVAFGQNPDPETGRIPLQLFMDGRAQAAYNHDKYELWQTIYSGGLHGREIQDKINNRENPTTEDYTRAGRWIDEQLDSYNVWIISMPNSQGDSIFLRSMLINRDWQTVFYDDNQRLLVDTQSERGRQLADAVLAGAAEYPDEFSRRLSTATLILESRSAAHLAQLKEHALAAFEIRPNSAAMLVLRNASTWAPIREEINRRIQEYLETFIGQKETLDDQAGYVEQLMVAVLAADHLASAEPSRRSEYLALSKQLLEESREVNRQATW